MLRVHKDFAKLAHELCLIPESDLAKITQCLNEAKYGFNLEDQVKSAVASAGVGEKSAVRNLTSAIVGLHYFYANSGQEIAEFPKEFALAVREALSDNKDMDFEVLDRLAGIVKTILEVDSIKVGAKAAVLLADEERAYIKAKIVTDIRPVFGDVIQESDMLKSAFIVHTLKLTYQAGGDEEFYVALSSKDLSELKRTIDRAVAKSQRLAELMPKFVNFPIEP